MDHLGNKLPEDTPVPTGTSDKAFTYSAAISALGASHWPLALQLLRKAQQNRHDTVAVRNAVTWRNGVEKGVGRYTVCVVIDLCFSYRIYKHCRA